MDGLKKNNLVYVVGMMLIFLQSSLAQNRALQTAYYYFIDKDSTCMFYTIGLYDSSYYNYQIYKSIIQDVRKACVNNRTVINIGYETKVLSRAKNFPHDSPNSSIPQDRYDPSSPFIPIGRYYESIKTFYFHTPYSYKMKRKKIKVK